MLRKPPLALALVIFMASSAFALTEFVQWGPPDIARGTAVALPEGGLEIAGYASFTSLQGFPVNSGLYIEWEVPDLSRYPMQYLRLIPENSFGPSSEFVWQQIQPVDQPLNWFAYPGGFAGGEHNAYRRQILAGDRLGILIAPDGRVEFYFNRGAACGAIPVFVSPKRADLSARYFAFATSVGGPGVVRRSTWQR